MDSTQDGPAFLTAMTQLSMALNTIELTTERLAAYWDALSDLRIDGVTAACSHLARHFKPDYKERFPVPATIREQAYEYRRDQQQLAQAQARALLPATTIVPDEEALAHIRSILDMLDAKMDMQSATALQDARKVQAARKATLLAQAQQLMDAPLTQEDIDDAE